MGDSETMFVVGGLVEGSSVGSGVFTSVGLRVGSGVFFTSVGLSVGSGVFTSVGLRVGSGVIVSVGLSVGSGVTGAGVGGSIGGIMT